MFTVNQQSYTDLKTLLKDGKAKNPICLYHPKPNLYFLSFDYFDYELNGWYQTVLCETKEDKEHVPQQLPTGKSFTSVAQCKLYASGIGFDYDSISVMKKVKTITKSDDITDIFLPYEIVMEQIV